MIRLGLTSFSEHDYLTGKKRATLYEYASHMDLPAPVSPVRTWNPRENSRSSRSMTAKLEMRSSVSTDEFGDLAIW